MSEGGKVGLLPPRVSRPRAAGIWWEIWDGLLGRMVFAAVFAIVGKAKPVTGGRISRQKKQGTGRKKSKERRRRNRESAASKKRREGGGGGPGWYEGNKQR